jgi:hypothetical protein
MRGLALAGLGLLVALGACGHWGGHWSHGHGRHWGGHQRACTEGRLDALLDRARRRIDPTPEQQGPWQRFADAVRTAARDVCGAATATAEAQAAQDMLARLERLSERTLHAVRTVRPSFDELYAVLNEAQRRQFDRWLSRRGWA